jgi:hypothetical protein
LTDRHFNFAELTGKAENRFRVGKTKNKTKWQIFIVNGADRNFQVYQV